MPPRLGWAEERRRLGYKLFSRVGHVSDETQYLRALAADTLIHLQSPHETNVLKISSREATTNQINTIVPIEGLGPRTFFSLPIGIPVSPSVMPSSLARLCSFFCRSRFNFADFAVISSVNSCTSLGLEYGVGYWMLWKPRTPRS
jgi:hypothetical protein